MSDIKKIISYEIVDNLGGGRELQVEIWGDLKSMPRNAELVMAIYGTWQRTSNGTLLYTQTLHPEDTEEENDSSLMDDYNALLAGDVEIVY